MAAGDPGGSDGAEEATRLWGGRFGAGPADALARLSVSVQFDWRLAPPGPTPGCCTGPGC
jgi:argininosuccinate lyase